MVLRCHVVLSREKSSSPTQATLPVNEQENQTDNVDQTYEIIIRGATGCTWSKDLRGLPALTFVQLYDYLVNKTLKYKSADVTSCEYKKLKAFQFFKEGHIKDMQVCQKDGKVFVKAEVLASMKSQKYSAIVVFDNNTKGVAKAACTCPAGYVFSNPEAFVFHMMT